MSSSHETPAAKYSRFTDPSPTLSNVLSFFSFYFTGGFPNIFREKDSRHPNAKPDHKKRFVQGIEVDLENEQGVRHVDRGSPPESVMVASSEHRRNSSSSSSSSSKEIPVKSEQEICADAKEMDSSRGSQESASGDDSRAAVDSIPVNNRGAEPSGASCSCYFRFASF